MIIHAFLFRWKPEVTADQKARVLAEILALKDHIPGILEAHAGTNFSQRSEGYEFGGVMKFADQAALHAYVHHPVHQELITWLMPLITPIELDFEG